MNQDPFQKLESFDITSYKIKEAYDAIQDYAFHGLPCILFGPTGAGKEFAAQHYYDTFILSRNDKLPFKKLNCAGLTEELAISELFGHVKGAFTGAASDKSGLFEEAKNGIIFLDEIGDLPDKVQSMLLRAVDPSTHEARRLGANKNYSTENVIVVCATDRPKKKLREALLNRLGLQVFIPGVNERKEDIPPAVLHFTKQAFKKRKDNQELIKKLFFDKQLKNYKTPDRSEPLEYLSVRVFNRLLPMIEEGLWPGNFREIRNAVDTAIIRAKPNKEIEKLVKSVERYYKIHLKTVDTINNYGVSDEYESDKKNTYESSIEINYDNNIYARVIQAIPKRTLTEKQIWASFFSQLQGRTFFRNELDELIPSLKSRAILYRLKAFEKNDLINRNGSKGDEYIFNNTTEDVPTEKSSFKPTFDLPDFDFFPVKRETEIEHVAALLENTHAVFVSGEKQSGKTAFVFLLGQKLMQMGLPVFYHELEDTKLIGLLNTVLDKIKSRNDLIIPEVNIKNENDMPVIAATLTGYLNTIFTSDKHPVMIIDNTDLLKSRAEIMTMNIMLQQWQSMSFVLVGKKLRDDFKMPENAGLAEYLIKSFNET
jgi:transcriptional regulator with AAA-type ATPase domain